MTRNIFGVTFLLILSTLALFGLLIGGVWAANPNGATIVAGTPETAGNSSPDNATAYAGNVTELTITSFSSTQSWQGYYGNVSGAIRLADSSGNALYNWSLADPEGEVYATTNLSLQWTNIQCFNFTANGTGDPASITGGSVNAGGVNLTTLESMFNIGTGDSDGVNETFNYTSHGTFTTASQSFTGNTCPSSYVYGDSGPVAGEFEEVLLYEPVSGSIVFTSILESGAVTGFNTIDSDFEMLVLEDGHGSDVDATTYFFFVELS